MVIFYNLNIRKFDTIKEEYVLYLSCQSPSVTPVSSILKLKKLF